MPEIRNSIGNAIRETRQKANITQNDLAKRSGLSRNYIAQIETGRKSPTLRALSAIADAIGVTLENIIGEDHVVIELRRIVDQANARRVLQDLKVFMRRLS